MQYPGVAESINSDIDNLIGILKVWNVFPKGEWIQGRGGGGLSLSPPPPPPWPKYEFFLSNCSNITFTLHVEPFWNGSRTVLTVV